MLINRLRLSRSSCLECETLWFFYSSKTFSKTCGVGLLGSGHKEGIWFETRGVRSFWLAALASFLYWAEHCSGKHASQDSQCCREEAPAQEVQEWASVGCSDSQAKTAQASAQGFRFGSGPKGRQQCGRGRQVFCPGQRWGFSLEGRYHTTLVLRKSMPVTHGAVLCKWPSGPPVRMLKPILQNLIPSSTGQKRDVKRGM